MPSILKANDVVKIYSSRSVVDGVSISVEQGEIVGLLGPNGAGKTTTFYMITGMIKQNAGEIFIDDENISNFPMYKRARMGIGYLPQEASIFRRMTVYENIYSVLEFMGLEHF
jgi:lipopolysaccharide export system ATP-binding protein